MWYEMGVPALEIAVSDSVAVSLTTRALRHGLCERAIRRTGVPAASTRHVSRDSDILLVQRALFGLVLVARERARVAWWERRAEGGCDGGVSVVERGKGGERTSGGSHLANCRGNGGETEDRVWESAPRGAPRAFNPAPIGGEDMRFRGCLKRGCLRLWK